MDSLSHTLVVSELGNNHGEMATGAERRLPWLLMEEDPPSASEQHRGLTMASKAVMVVVGGVSLLSVVS